MAEYYYNDKGAPTPTRIHVGVVVAIYYREKILFDHRIDGDWGLIGGAMEIGESITECVIREALEETGLEIDDLTLVGHFSEPGRIIQRRDEAVQLVTICFAANAPGKLIALSDESLEAGFFSRSEIEQLNVVKTHKAIVPWLFEPERWPVMA